MFRAVCPTSAAITKDRALSWRLLLTSLLLTMPARSQKTRMSVLAWPKISESHLKAFCTRASSQASNCWVNKDRGALAYRVRQTRQPVQKRSWHLDLKMPVFTHKIEKVSQFKVSSSKIQKFASHCKTITQPQLKASLLVRKYLVTANSHALISPQFGQAVWAISNQLTDKGPAAQRI